MDVHTARELLDRLASGELEEVLIRKEDFNVFREVLVKRNDFKHYRGLAQRGGDVIYQYLKTPRK
jgi:hypothetical protein